MYWLASFFGIVLFAICPIAPVLLCSLFGIKVNEATSTIGALPWALFFTVPAGAVCIVVWLIALVFSYLRYPG